MLSIICRRKTFLIFLPQLRCNDSRFRNFKSTYIGLLKKLKISIFASSSSIYNLDAENTNVNFQTSKHRAAVGLALILNNQASRDHGISKLYQIQLKQTDDIFTTWSHMHVGTSKLSCQWKLELVGSRSKV
jgi:hypothetical protein